MDDFFSKYGWVVAIGVIITFVITMMTPIGQQISGAIKGFVTSFAGQVTI